jgi:predicted nuclease of restriction endonuclease-like RecB superfamily
MKMKKISSSQLRRGMIEGYRSGLECNVGCQLNSAKVRWEYESERIPYTPKNRTYTPDFVVKGKAVKFYVETKGRFLGSDRSKHLLIQEQHPDLDIRFVFTNPNEKLYKGAKTTYGEWCRKHGFIYAKGQIPDEWLRECLPST